MLSFTRRIVVVMLTAVAVAGGGRHEAPRPLAASAHGDAIATRASSFVATHALPTIAFAKRQQSFGANELLLRPLEIQLPPVARAKARRIASTANDPQASSAPHTYDATGPPHRS